MLTIELRKANHHCSDFLREEYDLSMGSDEALLQELQQIKQSCASLVQAVEALTSRQNEQNTLLQARFSNLEALLGRAVQGEGPSRYLRAGSVLASEGSLALTRGRPSRNAGPILKRSTSSKRRTRRLSDASKATSYDDALEQFASAASSIRWSDTDSMLGGGQTLRWLNDSVSPETSLQRLPSARLSPGARLHASAGRSAGGSPPDKATEESQKERTSRTRVDDSNRGNTARANATVEQDDGRATSKSQTQRTSHDQQQSVNLGGGANMPQSGAAPSTPTLGQRTAREGSGATIESQVGAAGPFMVSEQASTTEPSVAAGAAATAVRHSTDGQVATLHASSQQQQQQWQAPDSQDATYRNLATRSMVAPRVNFMLQPPGNHNRGSRDADYASDADMAERIQKAYQSEHVSLSGNHHHGFSGAGGPEFTRAHLDALRAQSHAILGRESWTNTSFVRGLGGSGNMAGTAGTGNAGAIRNRYLENIPARLRQAYERQSQQATVLQLARSSRGHPSVASAFGQDTFPALPMSSSVAVHSTAQYSTAGAGVDTGTRVSLDGRSMPSLLSGEQNVAGAPVQSSSLSRRTNNLARASFTSVGAGPPDTPAWRANLIKPGPVGPSLARTSNQGPWSPHSEMNNTFAAKASAGGEAALHVVGGAGYQGNQLYVKAVGQDHQQLLGDEADPDRPLTKMDKLKLVLWGLINPEGRTKWDMVILILLIWVCFASPLIICFHVPASLARGDPAAIVEMIVDSFFVVDISFNFRTAYYDSVGNLITDRRRIARHYFRSWFFFDLVSIVPFDLITEGIFGFLSMLKLLRVVRVGKVLRLLQMYRLMRVTRLPRILERIEHYLDRGVLQITMFALSVGLLAHLSACFFHYMALVTYFIHDSWDGTWIEAQGLISADLAHRYVNSIYWAFTTAATVGYGDITPKNQKEKVLAILVMCSGVTLVGMVTSSITNIMSIRKAVDTKIAQKKQAVGDVLKSRQIPSALGKRVRAFFNYESTKLVRQEEESLLQDLPFRLRSRFLQHAYADTLCRVPCFVLLRPDILMDVISNIKCVYFTDGDIIALQGDYVQDTFFIHEGKLELRVYDFPDRANPWTILEASHKDELAGNEYTIQGRLKRTYYFGHASTVHGGTWPGTVIARNCCELFSMSKEAMEGLAARHPETLGPLLEVAAPPSTDRKHADNDVTIDLLQVDVDIDAIAADFPILDPPPNRRGLGRILVGAVKDLGSGITSLAKDIATPIIMTKSLKPWKSVGGSGRARSGPGVAGDEAADGDKERQEQQSGVQALLHQGNGVGGATAGDGIDKDGRDERGKDKASDSCLNDVSTGTGAATAVAADTSHRSQRSTTSCQATREVSLAPIDSYSDLSRAGSAGGSAATSFQMYPGGGSGPSVSGFGSFTSQAWGCVTRAVTAAPVVSQLSRFNPTVRSSSNSGIQTGASIPLQQQTPATPSTGPALPTAVLNPLYGSRASSAQLTPHTSFGGGAYSSVTGAAASARSSTLGGSAAAATVAESETAPLLSQQKQQKPRPGRESSPVPSAFARVQMSTDTSSSTAAGAAGQGGTGFEDIDLGDDAEAETDTQPLLQK